MRLGTTRKGQKRGQAGQREAKARREQIAHHWNKYSADKYADTNNPVYAWDAIATCMSSGLPLPQWVQDYLLVAATEIASLSRGKVPHKRNIDRAVATALNLRGGAGFNPFTACNREAHELSIAFDVYTCHTRNWDNQRCGREGTHDWNTIFEDVAASHHTRCETCKRRISVATVKRAWYRRALDVIPPHLIERSESHRLTDILS